MTHAQRLERALQDRELVSIERSISDDVFDGYVLGVGTVWLLIAPVETSVLRLNGVTALRLQDIETIDAPESTFVARALEHQGEQPQPVSLALDSLRALVNEGIGRYPLVTLHAEGGEFSEVLIGVPVEWPEEAVELLEIDADAEWMDETQVLQLDEVTRVDFGARYEQLLWELGGPPPG